MSDDVDDAIDAMKDRLEEKVRKCCKALETLKLERREWRYDEADEELMDLYETAKDAMRLVSRLRGGRDAE